MLEKAHDVIVEKGWCQNDLSDPEGRVCAMGALGVAVFGDGYLTGREEAAPAARRLEAKAWTLLREEVVANTEHAGVVHLNDHEGTSEEDVLLTFKRAAERARLEGQ